MTAALARVLAVALTGLLAAGGVAGCTASDVPGGGQAAPSGTGSAAEGSGAAGKLPPASDSISRSELPLDYYRRLINQTDERTMGRAAAGGNDWEVKQEEFVAECMKKQGFEYQPKDVEPLVEGASDIVWGFDLIIDVPWLPDNLAEVERYGYGYSDLEDDAAVEVPAQAPMDAPVPQDPNDDYLASLSAEARQQYDIAMYGAEWTAHIPGDGGEAPAPAMAGCRGQAVKAHPSPMMATLGESPKTAYSALIAELQGQVEPDPFVDASAGEVSGFWGAARVDALNAEWLACFTGQYGEVVIPDPIRLIEASPEADWDIALPPALRNPSSAQTLAEAIGLDGEFWLEPGRAPDEYWSLAARPAEVKVALADFKCRQETNYVDRLLEITRQSQEQFIAANQAQLAEMAAVMERYIAE